LISLSKISKTVYSRVGLLQGSDLKAKSARGVMLLGAGTGIERVLKLARYMVVARILAPDAFGVMAIVVATSTILERLSDVGVRQSIIQNKKGDEQGYLNVAWWFQSLRGLALYGAGFLAAPWISQFYGMPVLLPLLRTAFLLIIFTGFVSPRVYVLEKRLKFGKYVFLMQASGLFGTLFTILLAFYLRNIWALVIGFVCEAVLRCLLSYVLCPFCPRLSIDRDSAKELLKFAKGMLGLPFMTILVRQIDIFVLAKMVSEKQLGMYYLALQLASQPVLFFSKIFGTVLLPAFAEKQDNKELICRAMLVIVKTVATLGIPFLAFVIICAGPIISVVYGAQYADVAVPFSILCLWGLVFTQASIVTSILIGLGLPHLHRRAVVVRGAVLIGLIYPAIVYLGLSGAALAVLAAYTVAFIMPLVWMRKLINLRLDEYAVSWVPGLGISLIVVVPTVLFRFLGGVPPMLDLVVGAVLCLGACVLGLSLLASYGLKAE
jgi:O-antigen/teichoic acid export membrane protein